MESLFIAGTIIILPVIMVYFAPATPTATTATTTPTTNPENSNREEISESRFSAKLRQEKILESMSPSEKRLFQSGYSYTPQPTISQDDPFLKMTNICSTIVLIVLVYYLVLYLSNNPSPISFKSFLYNDSPILTLRYENLSKYSIIS